MAPIDRRLHRAQMLRRSLLVMVVAARANLRHSTARSPGSRHSSLLHNLHHTNIKSQ